MVPGWAPWNARAESDSNGTGREHLRRDAERRKRPQRYGTHQVPVRHYARVGGSRHNVQAGNAAKTGAPLAPNCYEILQQIRDGVYVADRIPGSQAETAIVILDQKHAGMWGRDRSEAYTAITRAQCKMVLVGDLDLLATAAQAPAGSEVSGRTTLLGSKWKSFSSWRDRRRVR